jgi:hypothetical protein
MNLAECERIMGHFATKIKSIGSRWLEAFDMIAASDIRLNRRQSHGVLAGDGRPSRGATLAFEMQGRASIATCMDSKVLALRHTWERLLDFSKDFIQTLVCESAL